MDWMLRRGIWLKVVEVDRLLNTVRNHILLFDKPLELPALGHFWGVLIRWVIDGEIRRGTRGLCVELWLVDILWACLVIVMLRVVIIGIAAMRQPLRDLAEIILSVFIIIVMGIGLCAFFCFFHLGRL